MEANRKAKYYANMERLALIKKNAAEEEKARVAKRQRNLARVHDQLKSHNYSYRGESPKNCMCEIIPPSSNSYCNYFTGVTYDSCAQRMCTPGYGCVSRNTGTVCMRRIKRKKIVKVGKGKCAKVAASEAMYVPYATGYDRYY